MARGMRRRTDSNFQRQLIEYSKSAIIDRSLPLVHATQAWSLYDILDISTLTPKWCRVFKKDLLYFFVFRPSYVKDAGHEVHQLSLAPAVFVLRPEAVGDPSHVYPFDTGGAAAGAFADQADPIIPLEDYALESSHQAIRGFIGWAFGDLAAYFAGKLRSDILKSVPEHRCVVTGYVDIARMGLQGHPKHDKRASTVELASSQNVALPDNLLLTILPQRFIENNPEVRRKLRELKCVIRTYYWQPNRRPVEFQKDIMRLARKWYRSQGWPA